MLKTAAALLSGIALFAAVASAASRAATITFDPAANPAIAVSRALAPLAAGGALGSGYVGFASISRAAVAKGCSATNISAGRAGCRPSAG